MRSMGNNAAALLSIVGIGLQAVVCFFLAEGPIGGFHLGLFAAASLSYIVGLWLALRTAYWVPALSIAVLSLLLDLYAFYSVFIAPTSSTDSLILIVVPALKLLGIVPPAVLAGVLLRRLGPKAT